MREADFQAEIIKEIKSKLPGVIVLKNDPNYIQGIPDLSIFYKDKYAMLEVKKSPTASHRPNQDWYISHIGRYAYSRFINPENKEEVIDGMVRSFKFEW